MSDTRKKDPRAEEILRPLREKIDRIDLEIIERLNRRTEIVLEVARTKSKYHLEYHDPNRELKVYKRLEELNKGPFPDSAIHSVYREIMSASLSLEKPMKVAYLGPKGTYTHLASTAKFGLSFTYISCSGIRDVFNEVERRRADYGVVPVENSNEGVVNHTLDMFVDSDLKICGEILLEINHCLLSKQSDISKIREVYSHHQTIAQTRKWLRDHLPKVDIVEVSSNARAAELASENPYSGAIASKQTAEIYGLGVLNERIEDHANNITRFLITGSKSVPPSGRDKTSVMFSANDKVGALYHLLAPFYKNRVNLTRVESRPLKKRPWEYFFFLDMQGHMEEKAVKESLAELKKEASTFKILGSYPAADLQPAKD